MQPELVGRGGDVNVALNALRSRKAARKVFDVAAVHEVAAESLVNAVEGEAQLDARRTLDRIRAHLAQMNPARAETLLLHDLLGKELSEIAVLTGASVAAAQSRLVRGRADLFERLSRDGILPAGVPHDAGTARSGQSRAVAAGRRAALFGLDTSAHPSQAHGGRHRCAHREPLAREAS